MRICNSRAYSHSISARLSVCLSHGIIMPKPLNVSSSCFTVLYKHFILVYGEQEFCLGNLMEWVWTGDDRTNDNGVSGLDHVVGQGQMGNYWDR